MQQYERASETLHWGAGGGVAHSVTCLPQKFENPSWIPRSHALKEHGVVVVPPCFRGAAG